MKLTATQSKALAILNAGNTVVFDTCNGRTSVDGMHGGRVATFRALERAGLAKSTSSQHKEQRPMGPFGSNKMGYRTFYTYCIEYSAV